jgi:hypothetical protein
VGADTEIWTRQMAAQGCHAVITVEPNRRNARSRPSHGHVVSYSMDTGSAEHTELLSDSADLITMASSFHWANFEQATQ